MRSRSPAVDLGGTPEVERTYNNTALPYIFTILLLPFQTDDTLTLAPGVVLKFNDGQAFLQVFEGRSTQQGTVAQPIIFTHRQRRRGRRGHLQRR